jgi:hypothetical protein
MHRIMGPKLNAELAVRERPFAEDDPRTLSVASPRSSHRSSQGSIGLASGPSSDGASDRATGSANPSVSASSRVQLVIPPAPPSSEVIDVDDYLVEPEPPPSAPRPRVTLDKVALEKVGPETTALPPAVPDVLAREEAARARGFARAALILCAVAVPFELTVRAVPWVEALMLATFVAVGGVSVWTWRIAAEPALYTPRRARTFGAVAAVAALVVPYCMGVFSPAPIFVTLGITFFALGSDRVAAIGLPVVVAVGYAVLAGLVIMGVLPDVGLMSATSLARNVQLAMAATVPLVYLLALWQARLSRRAMVEAIERSNAAVRERMHRDKQLDEVNKDLDRLLSMAACDAGAFTGDICGDYVLGKLVGRGAMGEVYGATHARTGESAAVKLLLPGMTADSNLVLRFLREGEASAKLRAPNVVSVYEVGTTVKGAPYIAMELLRGHDLGWHLRHRTRLTLDEAVGIAEQVASGLEAARKAGIVHRDLKPQNVFLAQRERSTPIWKILDFGVSRLAGTSGTLTQDQLVGTPGYMSPEQAAGIEATHRSDVFSFGAMVYRALTGELPFTGPDTPQVLYQVVYKNPARPSELCPELPPDVDLVLAIALAKDMEDRFPSALDFAAALRDAAQNALDPSLRLHGRTVLAALPWGCAVRNDGADDSLER